MRYVISSKTYLSRTDEKFERAEAEVKSKLENMRKDKQKKKESIKKMRMTCQFYADQLH